MEPHGYREDLLYDSPILYLVPENMTMGEGLGWCDLSLVLLYGDRGQ